MSFNRKLFNRKIAENNKTWNASQGDNTIVDMELVENRRKHIANKLCPMNRPDCFMAIIGDCRVVEQYIYTQRNSYKLPEVL